jgi:hypothetical protein
MLFPCVNTSMWVTKRGGVHYEHNGTQFVGVPPCYKDQWEKETLLCQGPTSPFFFFRFGIGLHRQLSTGNQSSSERLHICFDHKSQAIQKLWSKFCTTVTSEYYKKTILFCFGWSVTESTITEATTGLLYQPRMMMDDECGVIGGMLGRGNRSTRRKPAPVALCPPQMPHDLTWARTGAATVGNRRLTAWAAEWPKEGPYLSKVPMLSPCLIRHLSTTPWRRMRKWSYSFTFHDLVIQGAAEITPTFRKITVGSPKQIVGCGPCGT